MMAKSNKSHDDQVFLLERKIRLLTEENDKLKERIIDVVNKEELKLDSAHQWTPLRGGANFNCKRCGHVSDILTTNNESWCWACKVDDLHERLAKANGTIAT
jgi:predicted Zn-ribbon and HTH transcriptional regulator